MTEVWTVVAVVGVATMAFKALGPVGLAGRELPPRLASVLGLLAPACSPRSSSPRRPVTGGGSSGSGAAAIAVLLRAPLLLVVVVAAVVAAVARALT